jgi:hypothetical protein
MTRFPRPPRPRPRALLLVALAAAVLVAACGHADSFVDGVLHKGDLSIRIGPVPGGWEPLRVDGADLAYRDAANDGSALFDVHCERRDDDAPLSILTGHLIMGTTDRDIQSEETLPFDGREAMHTQMLAKLDGVPLQYDIYVMKKDGCVYDLVYVAPADRFAQGRGDFERFALGLHATAPPVGPRLAPLGAGPAKGRSGADP